MSGKPEPATQTALTFHKGVDYAVIMKPGQTTDRPLANLYGIDREVTRYGNLFASAEDIVCKVCANGPKVPETVDELVRASVSQLAKYLA